MQTTRTLAQIAMPLKPEHVALLNPYANDTQAGMDARQGFRDQLRAQGISLRLALLYTPDGMSGGTRVGLMDDGGFFAEYFFSREGQQDIRKSLRTLNDHTGKAPAFWATDLL